MSSNSDLFELLIGELNDFVIVVLDTQGKFRSWHPGVARQFGYDRQEFLGQHLRILLPRDERNSGSAERELTLAREAGQASDTRWLARKGGERVFAEGWTIALRRSNGELAGFGKVIHNVTGRRAAEEELRALAGASQQELERANMRLKEMANELERSNEDLEEFARIASHDLSAPITTTRWLVDLLSMRHGERLDAEGKKCLKQISLGLERMGDLVEAVLAHAQVGKGAIGSSQLTRAEDAFAAALENLRKDIILSEAVIDCGPLPELLIQPQPLTQLFQNLLSNAIKYRQPGLPLKIKVSSSRTSDMWQIAVGDNGVGIPPEWFERIFQPLQRRHGMEIPGSGIGLATCKKIVTRAGGTIWVQSVVGEGSTFYFTLPGLAPEAAHSSTGSSDVGKTSG